jgi:hypothetical protein
MSVFLKNGEIPPMTVWRIKVHIRYKLYNKVMWAFQTNWTVFNFYQNNGNKQHKTLLTVNKMHRFLNVNIPQIQEN